MTKKVPFPLKAKIISFISVLLLSSIGVYGLFALDLFKKDKTAYVYEASLTGLDQVASRLNDALQTVEDHHHILRRLAQQDKQQHRETERNYQTQYLEDNQNIIAFIQYTTATGPEAQDSFWISPATTELLGIEAEEISNQIRLRIHTDIQSPSHQRTFYINNFSHAYSDLPAHMTSLSFNQETKKLEALIFDISNISQALSGQRVFDYFLKDKAENILPLIQYQVAPEDNLQKILQSTKYSPHQQGQHQEVSEVQSSQGETFLIGHHFLDRFDISIYSAISKSNAFAASNFLIRQSIYFALLVLSISVILGVLFSKTLTKQLEKLYQATLRIAEGHFETKVQLSSNDEIGSLSKSFNFMSEEILKYMDQMKEKHRLENELAVAKLVQETFFPPSDITSGPLSISTYHQSATECGGDWWGHIQQKDQTIFFIADATGHGVPAAFLTATINSSVQTLNILSQKHPDILSSPSHILKLLNENVLTLNGDILLTSFVGIVNHSNSELTYSNASHLEPLILRVPPGETPSKKCFLPLLEGKGPRIGHKEDGIFIDAKFQLEKDDIIILWSDGITEMENSEAKQWGQRNFLKSILRSNYKNAADIRNTIIEDSQSFAGETQAEDDITLFIAKNNGNTL